MARTIINLDSTTQQSEWFNLIGGSSLAIIDSASDTIFFGRRRSTNTIYSIE